MDAFDDFKARLGELVDSSPMELKTLIRDSDGCVSTLDTERGFYFVYKLSLKEMIVKTLGAPLRHELKNSRSDWKWMGAAEPDMTGRELADHCFRCSKLL